MALYGALVNFLRTNPDGKEAVHPMGSKTIQGVFAGYHQAVGGMWSGDLYVVPLRISSNTNRPIHIAGGSLQGMFMSKRKRAMRETQRTASSSLLPDLKKNMEKRLEALEKSSRAHSPPPLMSPSVPAHRKV